MPPIFAHDSGTMRVQAWVCRSQVGTVGGGTHLAAQKVCLSLLGVAGAHAEDPGANSRILATVVAAAVMAGELSLLSALSAGHLMRAHMQFNRKAEAAAAAAADQAAAAAPRARPRAETVG